MDKPGIVFFTLVAIVVFFFILELYNERKIRTKLPDNEPVIEETAYDEDMVLFEYGGEKIQMRYEEYEAFCSLSRNEKRAFIREAKKKHVKKTMTETEAEAAMRLSKESFKDFQRVK